MILLFYCVISVFITLLINLHQNTAVGSCIPGNTLNGRYTRDIDTFKLAVPFKITTDGKFTTFDIPSFYKYDELKSRKRKKRSLDDPEIVHYIVHVNGRNRHAQLWPNHGLISPDAVVERYEPKTQVKDKKLRKLSDKKMCLYTGQIRDHPGSRVALSTCDGLAGYIVIGGKRFFIEPVEDHVPNTQGQLLHIVYEKDPRIGDKRSSSRCGTSDDWQSAWKKRFYQQYSQSGDNNNSLQFEIEKRGTASVHRYLETLIVCDKKFLDHHKNTDYETYVLTVFNMVGDFYHDSSSGNQMDVVVVRIMYLDKEEEEIDLVINENAEDTLSSFCKWQQKINPKDVGNPNHHDIAVLLTRYDICSDNLSNCGLMGLAYVASACTSNEPCAINEDSGLLLGIVTAHEMGHVMGCAHDKEDESACPAQDKDESYYVMSPFVHMFTTRWSTCSKGFITSLFESGLGECLNDEPESSIYKNQEILPGVVYDIDQQCRMFAPNSTVCSYGQENMCEMLLCQVSATNCITKEEPPADGTKCGENKWCYRKKCVEVGSRPEAINGGWGQWSSMSECSRTCGGGVQTATRECNNPTPQHNGRYCIGERKKVKTCNMDPCPPGTPSFRDAQCKEHNNKPFQGMLHQWKEFFKADQPCVLFCVNNENTFAKLAPRVKDGTKCKPGTRNMCMGGVCKKIGCDGEVDSNAVEDICGICNGDGTQCTIVDKVYSGKGRQYHKVAVIPVGSRNVLIEELQPSINTLAISDVSEKRYFLNGGFKEEKDGDKYFGEVQGLYTHPEHQKENLVIHGPLTEDLVFFVVFYRPDSIGYHYSYAEPSISVSYAPKYHWEMTEWEDCSSKCGGGVQNSKYTCVEEKSGKVSNSFCENMEKPEVLTKRCNEQPCRTKWKVGKWGKCNACKFKSGVRMREVECVQESPHAGTDDILVEDEECGDPRPGSRELCNSHKKCKTRRHTDGLPDDLMESVWKQVFHEFHNCDGDMEDMDELVKNKSEYKRQSQDKGSCHHFGNDKHQEAGDKKAKLHVGQIVKDRIPQEEIKLIEVPLKQSHLSVDLSDAAFETMGDKVGDSIDTSKAKIATGEAAARLLNQLDSSNNNGNQEHKHKDKHGNK